MTATPLSPAFFARPAQEVAPELLGMYLVHEYASGKRLVGRIVETEAYAQEDPAWHGWGICDLATGRVEPRGRGIPLFGPPGMAYIHLCYGMHWLLNVVTEPEGYAGCVLIRAVEPLEGQDVMRERRVGRGLTNGPAKMTQAFGIDSRFHKKPLTTPPLYLAQSAEVPDYSVVARSPRIGVRHGVDYLYRFYLEGHPSVSRR